jgi:Arc/MetJ family transcription regulator
MNFHLSAVCALSFLDPCLQTEVQTSDLLTWHHNQDIVVPMAGTTKRLSVALDHRLLAEARRLTCSRTKRETIAKALEELVKLEHRKALAHALGTGVFETTEAEFRSLRRRTHART